MGTNRREPRASIVQGNSPDIENRQRRVRLSLSAIERFQQRLNRELGLRPGAAFVRFVTDAEMKRLNQRFRKKAKTTDVLSFPSETRNKPHTLRSRTMEVRGSFLGDIAISPTVAARNAKAFGRTISEEIIILMLHGFLHLLGYDHETDRGEMERVEATLRRRLGLS
ncbi:MAG TPA: rRNA maturation RNase YbeY [Candidatus Acidoferrum sp.]|nr:rRNA maturation RNase YbeY [Candidatus Acidoferrum sp.]